jgi:hypothetical protein
MNIRIKIILFLSFILAAFAAFLFFVGNSIVNAADSSVTITVKISVCGNDVKEGGEECDGNDFGSANCQNQGFTGGILGCEIDCSYNTSSCTSCGDGRCNGNEACGSCPSDCGACQSGGGGSHVPAARVIFSGKAYPKSKVTLLKDAQAFATSVAGANANFQIELRGLSVGNYISSIYSEDKTGRHSSLTTLLVDVTPGATTNVSDIFIPPTIDVDKSHVKRGDNLVIFGQSIPGSKITIFINSKQEIFKKIQPDSEGVYLYNLDTSVLGMGQHLAKSKATLGGKISSFSKTVSFVVGGKSINEKPIKILTKGDPNGDGRVNLVDFSVMAHWYKRTAPPADIDLNNDKKVDLIDFSIMAFYWTG